MERHIYPFSAIVGQDQMRKALIFNAIDPAIGGVLIRGEKGTAKSTAVRGLAAVLPPRVVVRGCPFSCNPGQPEGLCPQCAATVAQGKALALTEGPTPVIDLPLNASEDRVVGTLDLEEALTAGRKTFAPGLLAAAHRAILYVDEVNLLDDHLVDVLLDEAGYTRSAVCPAGRHDIPFHPGGHRPPGPPRGRLRRTGGGPGARRDRLQMEERSGALGSPVSGALLGPAPTGVPFPISFTSPCFIPLRGMRPTEEASKADPLIPLRMNWEPAGCTLRQVLDRLIELRHTDCKPLRSASDLGDLMYRLTETP